MLVLACSCDIGDSGDSFVTARVESVSDRRICLDAVEYDDVDGCYPARVQDVTALSAGDCIDVRIPYELDPDRRDDPLYGVEKLRPSDCER